MDVARTEFEVMFWGPVHVSKEVIIFVESAEETFAEYFFVQAIRVFREVNPPGKGGRIFNLSSTGGYSSQPLLSYYNAAKFGM